jgi:acetate kinase
MKILVLNCGSSSLKFRLFDHSEPERYETLSGGIVRRIGEDAEYDFKVPGAAREEGLAPVLNHEDAVRLVLNWIGLGEITIDPRKLPHDIDAVGHRIVHGGHYFDGPAVVDEETIERVHELGELAPLHNYGAAKGIRAARKVLGPEVPMTTVFDTAFFASIPETSAIYAIPYELSLKHAIRRYGAHGTAHRYMDLRYGELTGRKAEGRSVVTLQLGNGSSVAAIRAGSAVDMSMGFTPLEGLVMGTRSGDIDPAVLVYLAKKEGMSIEDLDTLLNHKSGLLGVSGYSNDMARLMERYDAPDSARIRLAVNLFCHRVKKYIGAYLALLGGADAIVFGGGIGENAVKVREIVCAGMEWCGLKLDPDRNRAHAGQEGRISTDDSTLEAWVVPIDEEVLIARDTVERLGWS